MKYTYKERVRLARKLKVFLAIFFAAITFFTGKVILDKTFADEQNYGTATITFNSGTDGHFEDGTTTNIVTYNLKKDKTRYSHTTNVSDDGELKGEYTSSVNYNDVVSFPGVSTLHVTIIYATNKVDGDYACVWEGNHPDYTAINDYSTSVSGKLGGGKHTNPDNTKEYDIIGDSVTFGFTSDNAVSYNGGEEYGYFAIVTAPEDEIDTLILGDIVSGEYKDAIGDGDYTFNGWGVDINTLSSSTTVMAQYLGLVDSGTYDGIDWRLKADKTLIIGREGETQQMEYKSSRSWTSYPWKEYYREINKIIFEGQVIGNGSLAEMFRYQIFVQTADLTNLDVTSVTSLRGLFSGAANPGVSQMKLKTVIFGNWNTSNVADMSYMFYCCPFLISLDVSEWNTENVTDLSHMFDIKYNIPEYSTIGSSDLTELDVSNWDTSNVTNMSYLFAGRSGIEVIDVSGWNTDKVTNMACMFALCESVIELDVSNWNTSNVTNMLGMFAECVNVRELDVSNWNTSNVTNMGSPSSSLNNAMYDADWGMFGHCASLTELDVSNFDTSKVTKMNAMFYGCGKIKELDVSNFDTSKVTTMDSMFQGCNNVSELDLSNFDTSLVQDMDSMFAGIGAKHLDLSSFNTSNVIRMYQMFLYADDMVTLNISGWDTSNVTTMGYMFAGCFNLKNIDVSSFNTSNVTDMSYMFYSMNLNRDMKLKVLDLSSFDTSNVTSMNKMFDKCGELEVISLGGNWGFKSSNGLKYSWKRDGDTITYTAAELTSSYDGSTMSGIYRRTDIVMSAMVYDNGELVFQKGNTPDSTKGNVLGTYTGFDSTTYNSANNVPWYSNRTNITKITFKDELAPVSTAFWFYGMTNLNKLNNISNLNTSLTTTTQSMFENCTKLTSFNLNTLNTNDLTNMNSMFKGCTNLQSLNMSKFKAENLTDVANIFTNTNLKTLTLGEQLEFNLLPVLDGIWIRDGSSTTYAGNQVFNEPGGVYRLQGTDVYAIVYDNGEMVFQEGNTPDTTKGNVLGSYTGFEDFIYERPSDIPWISHRDLITKIIFNTEVTPNMTAAWFSAMTNLTEIENLELLNTSNVTNMTLMFNHCESLTSIDLTGFDTSKVENMSYMFYNCASLQYLDVSSFDTSNLKNISAMFAWCENLISLDLSNFDTSKTDSMYELFYCDKKLANLDISGFDTSNVTSMLDMFGGCESLIAIDVSNFDTSKVTTMFNMFAQCENLTTLDLSSFDTSNVTNMVQMFKSCNKLTSLDLSNFDTSNVTNMTSMFSDCYNLTSVDVSHFDTDNVTNMSYLFSGCKKLTSLDLSGFDTSNVTTMQSMFGDCYELTSLDLSNFNTSNVINMKYIFYNCRSLTELDVSNFDTSNVTNMTDMFNGTTKLNTLKLGTNWNFLSDNGLANSWQREGDTTIYTAAELTANYNGSTMAGTYRTVPEAFAEFDSATGTLRIFRDYPGTYTNGETIDTKTYYMGIETITGNTSPRWYSKKSNIINVVIEDYFRPQTAYYMFDSCVNLTTITGIEYLDTSSVTNMDLMFRNCSSLTSLDVSGFNTNNVTRMNSMFSNCSSLTSLDVSNFDTNKVETMDNMFYGCSNLTGLDVSNFDTSNVTNMSSMFWDCSNLTGLDVSNFDTSKVINMELMFGMCKKLQSLELGNFDTSNVTNMHWMFNGCSGLIDLGVSNFDTNKVTDMSNMFYNCSNLIVLDISNFDTSNIINMQNMFTNTAKLNTLKLGTDWNFLSNNGLTKSWLRDGDTTIYTAEELTNSYEGSTMAGTYRAVQLLTISEQVKGALADINKNFDFTINVQNDGVGISSTHAYTGTKSGNLVFGNGVASFTLKHNDSISTYLPYGVNYTITQNSDGYILAKTNDTGTLDSDKTASFINTLNGTTPTGVFLNLIPYIIMLIIGTTGLLWIKSFKRI